MLGARLTAINKTIAAISVPTGEIILTNASGNWTVPTGVTSISVVAIGSGGRGNNQNTGARAGGGGGGLCYKNSISVTPGQSISYTVGQSVEGGSTTILGMTANPGQGSTGGTNTGGTASGGDVNFTGGTGFGGSLSLMNGGGAASYTANGINTQDGSGPGGAMTGKSINVYGLDPNSGASTGLNVYGMGGYSDDSGGRSYGQPGAIRIIWGATRSFPNNALATTSAYGEQSYTTPGTYTFTVPAGVTSLSVVCIGGGSSGYYANSNNCWGGGGGGLAWLNNRPVTPGETYTITVGDRGVYTSGSSTAQDGGMTSFGGVFYATGGTKASNGSNGQGGSPGGGYTGGFSGGSGTFGSTSTLGAGSAGGYTANGTAGGGTGSGLNGTGSTGTYGRGDNGNIYAPAPSNSVAGAVRIIWGGGRTFPNNASGGTTFATWNPSDKSGNILLSNGNLSMANNGVGGLVRSTISKSSGKWYWEVTYNNGPNIGVGVAKAAASLSNYLGADSNGYGYHSVDGNKYNNGSGVAYGSTYGASVVIGVALDLDSGTLTFYRNGVSQGVAYTGLTGTFFAAEGTMNDTGACTANFGASPFTYPVPSGYNAGLYG